ncbi:MULTISPECIES: glycosyltransferase [Methylomonas]|nr:MULTISPECIES: glycosyltransferase [Methylomonas]TCV76914.1 pentapeptide repeat protein [Methylomonas methanica]
MKKNLSLTGLFLILFGLSYAFLQIYVSWEINERSKLILQAVPSKAIDTEKTIQETIALRIENEKKTVFFETLLANVSAAIGVIVAVTGIWIAFRQHMDVRRGEISDRDSQNINALWEGIVSSEQNVRARSIAGLRHYLTLEKKEHHPRVAAALALVGRMDNNTELVKATLAPVLEKAFRELPDLMKSETWDQLNVKRLDLSGLDLSGCLFRNARLNEVILRNANLKDAKFDAASLSAADLRGANLSGASLAYADLAYADLSGAKLIDADLRHIKVLHLNLKDANLTNANLALHRLDWRVIKHWRTAIFDTSVKNALLMKHGPALCGRKILMVLWEFPPNVVGGQWTAAYHLLHGLRKRGADVTLLVPWHIHQISHEILGHEIEVIAAGESLKPNEPYLSAYSYGEGADADASAGSELLYRPTTFRLVTSFVDQALDAIKDRDRRDFDIIHAHDWVSFPAAAALSREYRIPWVAHFHSVAQDREEGAGNDRVRQIERTGSEYADQIVAPSRITASAISKSYGVDMSRIAVVPNSFSCESISEDFLGSFSSKRVVFLGRLTWQKGPDIFVDIARKVYPQVPQAKFYIFGKGDMETEIKASFSARGTSAQDPVSVGAISDPKQKHLYYNITFNQVWRLVLSPEGQVIEATPVHDYGDVIRDIEAFAFERGFDAYAFDTDCARIRIRGKEQEDGEDMHLDYLVDGEGLPKMIEVEQCFIFKETAPKWGHRLRVFEDASVIIVPSRHEPFGMVILEAMQSGVPVFVAKHAGAIEVLKTPVAIDLEDTDEAARLISEVLLSEDAWRTLSIKQREEVLTYAKGDQDRAIEELWMQVIDSAHLNEKSAGIVV